MTNNNWVTNTVLTCLGATVNFTGKDITCVRGGRLVFRSLNFEVAAGNILFLRGPNGSGKSSLLRLVAGFQAPTEGLFLWNDCPVSDDRDGHRARISYVGHLDAVKSSLSVAENLKFWARLGGNNELIAIQNSLDLWDLGAIADIPGAYLSAGQRRRLNLARLSVSTSKLWLLDEPTVSLDDAGVQTLMRVVSQHQDDEGSIIMATHTELKLKATDTLRMKLIRFEQNGTAP